MYTYICFMLMRSVCICKCRKYCVTSSGGAWKIVFGKGTKLTVNSGMNLITLVFLHLS